jgi:hypothetical protein
MAGFSPAWPDARHLTLSFAPEGTPIANHVSSLAEALARSGFTPADWQREVIRAFQTWAVATIISIGVVPEQLNGSAGYAFGTAGRTQGDPRFGDIRVAAHALAGDVLSVSVPPDPFLSGTWAGDVFLNSQATFDRDTLFAVLLHEAGHALGLSHSTNPSSVMFSHLNQRTTLAPSDVSAIRALYGGARAPDGNEGTAGNDRMSTATRIRYSQDSDGYNGATPLVVFGDITTSQDLDYFWIKPLDGYTGRVTFQLQTAAISALTARLTIYDEAGGILGRADITNPLGGAVSVTLDHVVPDDRYFARVEALGSDLFAVGRYGLVVTFDDNLAPSFPAERLQAVLRGPFDTRDWQEIQRYFQDPTGAFFDDDVHTDDTFLTAQTLRTPNSLPANSFYEVEASLSDLADVDIYRFRTPDPRPRPPSLVVRLTALASPINGVLPQVEVLNGNQVRVPAEVLLNGNGTLVLQADLLPNTSYFLRVLPNTAPGPRTGNYVVQIAFGEQHAELRSFASGSLDAATPQRSYNLFVARSQLFQFVLSAQDLGAPSSASVRLTIRDGNGNAIFTLSAPAGQTVSATTIFLAPGTYTADLRIEGGSGAPVAFSLRGINLIEPIGPTLLDPGLDPQFPCPGDASLYCYPGGFITADAFFWLAFTLPSP